MKVSHLLKLEDGYRRFPRLQISLFDSSLKGIVTQIITLVPFVEPLLF